MSSVLGISDDDDEFSVHYEFSPSVTSEDYACVNLIIYWVLENHKNPFNVESSCLKHKNIFTGESCPPLLTTYLLGSIDLGESLYKKFVKERLVRHSNQVPLKDPIPQSLSKALKSLLNKNQISIKPSEANNMCLRFVEIA